MDPAPTLDRESSHPASASSKNSTDIILRFPGEDGGKSLIAMAERDLDAALQLLADRAQYITGASGAAIALRRGAAHDMLCRASAGCNAPELGALLSTEFGLSGESVRTRQPLRCDDAEHDPRVNREGCRQLGIASVVIMPIVGDAEVIGVFELFSGKPGAFSERDLAALERLGKMVETAVQHAAAFQTRLEIQEFLQVEVESLEPMPRESEPLESAMPQGAQTEDEAVDAKRPLFWSAAVSAPSANHAVSEAMPTTVPPVLRQLQKCLACGFPVSPGRAFCVECEDKQWRGERMPQATPQPTPAPAQQTPFTTPPGIASSLAPPHETSEHAGLAAQVAGAEVSEETQALEDSSPTALTACPETTGPVFASAQASSSWFAANKIIVGAIVIVALVVAAIVWLR